MMIRISIIHKQLLLPNPHPFINFSPPEFEDITYYEKVKKGVTMTLIFFKSNDKIYGEGVNERK